MRRFTGVLALAGLLSGTGTACSSSQPQPSPKTALKPVLRGLLDRGGPPPAAFDTLLAGFVVNVHWADVQPSAGGPLTADNAIDRAIAQVRQLNAAGAHLGLKIRFFAGIWAPDWAKNIDGPPVTVRDPISGTSGTVGRFWTEGFGRAYQDLQAKLAARYDGVPEIREVTISRCTTVFAEPFIRDAGDPGTLRRWLDAGFTVGADRTCHREQIQAHTAWQHTHSDLAFNPYQVINPDGTRRTDESFTEQMMSYCRQLLSARCVLENNSLRWPVGPLYEQMYGAMKTLGPPIAFQTAVMKRVGDLQAALRHAVMLGANSVELPGGYETLGTAAFTQVANELSSPQS